MAELLIGNTPNSSLKMTLLFSQECRCIVFNLLESANVERFGIIEADERYECDNHKEEYVYEYKIEEILDAKIEPMSVSDILKDSDSTL